MVKKMCQVHHEFFKIKVDGFDPSNVYTDAFFFDRAANVQKVGQILCTQFLKQCVFMAWCMLCHCFSVAYQGLVQLR